jgi:hypothetical protein
MCPHSLNAVFRSTFFTRPVCKGFDELGARVSKEELLEIFAKIDVRRYAYSDHALFCSVRSHSFLHVRAARGGELLAHFPLFAERTPLTLIYSVFESRLVSSWGFARRLVLLRTGRRLVLLRTSL